MSQQEEEEKPARTAFDVYQMITDDWVFLNDIQKIDRCEDRAQLIDSLEVVIKTFNSYFAGKLCLKRVRAELTKQNLEYFNHQLLEPCSRCNG